MELSNEKGKPEIQVARKQQIKNNQVVKPRSTVPTEKKESGDGSVPKRKRVSKKTKQAHTEIPSDKIAEETNEAEIAAASGDQNSAAENYDSHTHIAPKEDPLPKKRKKEAPATKKKLKEESKTLKLQNQLTENISENLEQDKANISQFKTKTGIVSMNVADQAPANNMGNQNKIKNLKSPGKLDVKTSVRQLSPIAANKKTNRKTKSQVEKSKLSKQKGSRSVQKEKRQKKSIKSKQSSKKKTPVKKMVNKKKGKTIKK